MFDFVWNLVSFVVALGILITVHEYGHFWVARKNNVKVQKFSIGFGKTLWSKIGKDGTEYVIALIPLGGFVKMLDERIDEVSSEDADKTFNCKSVYQRIAIVAAGPLANFVFAIVAFYLMFLIGVPSVKPIIGDIKSQSIAAEANLPAQSQIIEVAGKKITDWQDVNLALVGEIGSQSINIKTKKENSVNVVNSVLNTSNWSFSPDTMSPMTSLGIIPFKPKVYNEVALVQENSPAEVSGLLVGDIIVEVNGVSINNNWHAFTKTIKQSAEQSIPIKVLRNERIQLLTAVPANVKRNGENIGYLGVSPKSDRYPDNYKIVTSFGVIDAVGESIHRTWNLVTLSFDMIGKLFTGDVSVKNLSGPISIAQGAGNSANIGLVYFLGFLALISINLGIINLLPLPVLDGGHLLYFIIELFSGKPVPEKFQEIGFKFGTMALLCLMSIALFNDLSRL